ncbi:unnamed protein product [Urochloa decumbens]|uniref:Uncharacterized protein n=1 Tax=Urochloa decumbens TaxID=240449 RepID=A0ABC9D670_9POAL
MSTPTSDPSSDVEKGIVGRNNPARAAAASMTAAEGKDAEPVVVTDPRQACLVNFAVAVFSGVAILIFALTAYSMFTTDGGSLGEMIGCTVLAFAMCAAAVGTALYLRKDIISILSESPRPDE